MARVFGVLLMLGLVSESTGRDAANPLPKGVPELSVSLALAEGFVPLDEADEVPYRFVVNAMDPEAWRLYANSEVLVRHGQKRDLKRGPIRGSVHLREDGLASYRAELVIDGKIVARTRATVKVKTSR